MGERYLRQCRNFCSDDVSAFRDRCCTKHPSGFRSGDGYFFRLFAAPVIWVRGGYLVPKSQAILTRSVYRRTRKSSVPNRVQGDEQSHGFTSFEWLTAWAAKMPFPLGRGEWGPNQSAGFTSFTPGSPSRPGQLSKGSSGYPNIFW